MSTKQKSRQKDIVGQSNKYLVPNPGEKPKPREEPEWADDDERDWCADNDVKAMSGE